MQSNNRMFEDAAKLAGGALGTLASIRREVEALVQQQLERLLARMDLITRDEFETVKLMAATAREENEKLTVRLNALEAGAGKGEPKAKPGTKPRARSKSSAAPAKD